MPGDGRSKRARADVLLVRTKLSGTDTKRCRSVLLDKPRRIGHLAATGVKLPSHRRASRAKKRARPRESSSSAKADCEPQEIRPRVSRGRPASLAVGGQVKVDGSSLEGVKAVDVTATSKGRGFTGAMKRRHNFSGQRATHGVKKCAPCSSAVPVVVRLAASRGGGRMKKVQENAGPAMATTQTTTRNQKTREVLTPRTI